MTAANTPNKVYERVVKGSENECWLWIGRFTYHGYGTFDLNNRAFMAHRIVYELEKGPVPAGMEVMHTCQNRACCNPRHLEAGTHAENMKTRRSKLTQFEMLEIRKSPLRQGILADEYGVNQSTISRIIKHSRLYRNV